MRTLIMGLVLGVLLATSQVANATVLVDATGTWTSVEDTNLISTYGGSGSNWSFSFDLPNPISTNPTTQATDFTSTFKNAPSIIETNGSVSLSSSLNPLLTAYDYTGGVWFNPDSLAISNTTISQTGSSVNGLALNLCESSCSGADVFYFTGADILSNTSTLLLGTFSSMSVSLNDGGAIGNATITVSNIGGNGGIAATPEPPTFWLMATGILGMFGWVGLRRIKISA
ncbi:hypothetical protein [Leptospirillum ferriphilum]|nr:hypothetical protein [Leptospirillum ferriphilum]